MDKRHLHTLRNNILMALRKAEAQLQSGSDINLDLVADHVRVFQNYLTRHMPQQPSDSLKTLVHDTFIDIQNLSDQIGNEIALNKQSMAELTSSQKLINTYTYGIRKL